MPNDLDLIPHSQILRYEEILRICAISANLGIRRIKVTGGEPLVRKGCLGFLKRLKAVDGIESISITTNGILLEPCVQAISEMGLDCVNISLDTLNPAVFAELSGMDALNLVLNSLHAALRAGLRVKVNCVLMRGINDGEILAIAELAEKYPVDVRFIELMPSEFGQEFIRFSGDEALSIIAHRFPGLKPESSFHGSGPAKYFTSPELLGSIGFIDAIGNCFCEGCNRIRLTSAGFLKLCLSHGDGLDLRAMLRSGATDIEMERAIEEAVRWKPKRHIFNEAQSVYMRMSQIGG
jgi:cyclic pyranopterin phosphate synthase